MSWTLSEPFITLLSGLKAQETSIGCLELGSDVENHALDLRGLNWLSFKELKGHNHWVTSGGGLLKASRRVLDKCLYSLKKAGKVGAE